MSEPDVALSDIVAGIGVSARQLLEGCPDGFVAMDAAWRITYVNAAAERINGERREELLGRDHWEVYPAAVGTAVHEGFLRVMAERVPLRIENYYAPWDRWFELDAFPTPDGGIAIWYRDVTDRKHAEQELRRRQDELTDFVENAVVGLHWVGPDGTILWANKAELDLLGYGRDEYIGRNIAEFHADPPVIEDILCRLKEGQELHAYEARLRCKDGSVRTVLISSNVLYEDGEFRHTRCFTRDITDRKRAETLVAGQNRVLELAVGGAPLADVLDVLARTAEAHSAGGILASVLLLDRDGAHLRHGAAPSLPKAYNRAIDGVAIGPSVGSCGTAAFTGHEVIVSDIASDPLWADFRDLALDHGLRACWSTPIVSSRGETLGTFALYYRVPKSPPAADRQVVELLSRTTAVVIERHREADERRRVEEALRESRERLRAALEGSGAGTFRWDIRTNELEWDENLDRLFGLPPGRTIRSLENFIEAVHPDDRAGVIERCGRCARDGADFDMEFRVLWPDGSVRWLDDKGKTFSDIDGRPASMTGMCIDVTARKRAEEALRESEERYRTLFDSMDEGYCIIEMLFDPADSDRAVDYRFIEVNPAFETQAGMHDAVGRRMLEFVPSIEEHWLANYGRVALTGEPIRFANEYKTLNRWFDVYAFRVGPPEARRVAVLFTDITGRKRAEAALLASEERFKAAVAATSEILWTNDASGRMTRDQPGWGAFTGQTPDEYEGYGWAAAVHPDDSQPTIDAWNEAVAARRTFVFEHRVRRRDGVYRDFSVRAVPVLHADGTVREWVGTHTDITERKAAEVRQRFLADLAAETQALADPEELTAVTARRLADHLGCDRCAYAEVENESVFVITGDYTRGVPSIVGRWPVAAFGDGCARAMQANEPYVVEDAEADRRIGPEDLPAYRATLIRAVICVPLHKGGRFTAGMAVHQATPRRWTAEEIGLVREVVGRCWEALERARANRAVRESEARLSEVFRQAPAFMCVLSGPDHAFIHANDRYLELIGRREILGKRVRDALPDLEGQGFFELLDQVYATGEPFVGRGVPVRILREAGRPPEERCLDFVYQALRGPDGSVTGVFVQGVDVTERTRAEEALREADRKKDQFLATLAHELRNPLAPVSNALQAWPLVEHDAAESGRLREMMGRQVRQMVRLIDDLLDVSRITRGKIELRKERVELASVVEGSLESVRPLLESCGHELSVSLPSEPVTLDGDAGRLIQVFGNLLNNAAKYAGRNGHVWVTAERDGDCAVVSVRDDGPGIPADMLGRIFEMFTQVDQTLDRSQGGLGIGLTLARTLIELHGGSIEARSDGPGRGAEFIVRLPIARAAATRPAVAMPAAADSPRSLPRLRVLVVDDVKPSANTLAMMLKSLGQETRAAYDGPSAIAAAAEFRPDLVISDIAMPGMDGFALAGRLRQADGAGPVLVALTGYGQEQDRRQTFDAGFHRHLVKPTSVAALRELLASLDGKTTP